MNSSKRLVLVGSSLVAALAMAGCGGSSTYAAPPAGCSAATAVATTSVTIQGMAFSPHCIAVAKGAVVTFTNNDTVPHTVTADDGTYNGDLATTGATKVFTHPFSTAGTSNYHCAIHVAMTGTVIVQ
jgi:plastocyanin